MNREVCCGYCARIERRRKSERAKAMLSARLDNWLTEDRVTRDGKRATAWCIHGFRVVMSRGSIWKQGGDSPA